MAMRCFALSKSNNVFQNNTFNTEILLPMGTLAIYPIQVANVSTLLPISIESPHYAHCVRFNTLFRFATHSTIHNHRKFSTNIFLIW